TAALATLFAPTAAGDRGGRGQFPNRAGCRRSGTPARAASDRFHFGFAQAPVLAQPPRSRRRSGESLPAALEILVRPSCPRSTANRTLAAATLTRPRARPRPAAFPAPVARHFCRPAVYDRRFGLDCRPAS